MPRFVFSALYNETAEYLEFFVQNFLNFTGDESVIFINVSQTSLAGIDRDFGPRVHLFHGKIARSAWGPTLLAGHMECFDAASEVHPDFEWFITMASNSLFFRRFNPELVVETAKAVVKPQKAPINWDELPDNWHWPKMRQHRAIGNILQQRWKIEGLAGGQIEGRVAHRNDWSILNSVQSDILHEWTELKAPLEEILPLTVFNALGSGLSCNICRNHWGRPEQDGGRFSQMWELINPVNLPPQFCMMKWFQRDNLCPETLAVSTPIGQYFLEAAQSAAIDPRKRFEIECLLRSFLNGIEHFQSSTPITFAGLPANVTTFQHEAVVAQRQICALDGGPMISGQSYLYFESTAETLSLSLDFATPETLKLKCDLGDAPVDDQVPDPYLQAYLYLAVSPDTPKRIEISGSISGVAPDQFLSRITVHSKGRYAIQKPISRSISSTTFTAYFMCAPDLLVSHVGLPIFAGQNLVVSLSEISERTL